MTRRHFSLLIHVTAAFLAFAAILPSASARTVHVAVDSTNPVPPYETWETAAQTIQDGVDVAVAGDTVLVGDGVYSVGGRAVDGSSTNRVVIGSGILLKSANGPLVTVIEGAEAPGGGNGPGAVRCAYVGEGATLSGFTLTKGHTNSPDQGFSRRGGGAFCDPTAVLEDCIIRGNSSHDDGGGVYRGTIYRSQLIDNVAFINSGARSTEGDGGGADSCTLYNCILSGNRGRKGGGADNCTLYNCVLTGNKANVFGGGIARSVAYNCTITGNSARIGGGVGGRGIDERSQLFNCIVYHNRAVIDPNFETDPDDFETSTELSYCCTTPLPAGGTGNIDSDPLLASWSHLSPDSPCLGAGSALHATGLDIDGQPWAGPPAIGADEAVLGAGSQPLSVAIETDFTRLAVGFAATFKLSIEGPAVSSRWSFGDGSVVHNGLEVVHAWSAPGTYPVELTAFADPDAPGVTATVLVEVIDRPVHYVDQANPNPVAPYTTMETAATTIQEAIDIGDAAGRLVLVADGTYETGSTVVWGAMQNRVALVNGVEVRSLNGPDVTTIRGESADDPSGPVRCAYVGDGSVLEGFTLTGGHTMASGHASREQGGGGAWCERTGVVKRCAIHGNHATKDGGGANGGVFHACRFFDNTAGDQGPGADDAALFNCTLTQNWASESILQHCTVVGQGFGQEGFQSKFTNCILHSITNYYGSVFYYCCIGVSAGGDGIGNIVANPKFLDLAGGNLRLQPDSPCIDAGMAGGLSVPRDFDGKPRAIDGNRDCRPVPDMGAFEFGASLELTREGAGASLSWVAAPGEQFVLQESDDLEFWILSPEGSTSPISIDFSEPTRFFRLVDPAPGENP